MKPTKPKTENWEKEFSKEFLWKDGSYRHEPEYVRSFIRSLLQQARQEGREEMIEKVSRMKKKMRGIEIRQWGEVRGVDYPDDAYNRSVKEYNKVIEDVISELKKKEGK
jgi:hypothetical protein